MPRSSRPPQPPPGEDLISAIRPHTSCTTHAADCIPLDAPWTDLLRRLAASQPSVARALEDYDQVRVARAEAKAATNHGRALPCLEEIGNEVRFAAVRVDAVAAGALAEADRAAFEGPSHEHPGRWLAAEVLSAIAQLRRNEVEEGIPRLQSCERRCREAGLEHLLLPTLTELARALSQSGEPLRAIELLQEAVELARRRGDRRAEAQNLLNLGFVFGEKDEPEQYARYTREGLALFTALDEPYGRAMAHCNLGGALSRMLELDEAEASYRASRSLAERFGFRFVEALCLGGEGGVYCERGDLARGRELYEASNTLLTELGNSYQVTRHLYLLGKYTSRADLLDEAHALLSVAVEMGRSGGFGTTLATALESLSVVCERQGHHELALRHLREHLATQKRVVEAAMEDRVRAAERRAQAEAAQREAEYERRRSDELHQVNHELRAALARQRDLQSELMRVSHTDPLTRLSNRRHLRELLDREVHRLARRFRPLSLMLIDVDHFKSINDRFGHDVGDEVLVELATRLRASVRGIDPVGRWGGEEFCVAVFETDVAAAAIPAENLRARIAEAPFQTRVGPLSLTVSVGVASLGEGSLDVDEVLRRADQALYEAKARGRNCVVAAP